MTEKLLAHIARARELAAIFDRAHALTQAPMFDARCMAETYRDEADRLDAIVAALSDAPETIDSK